MEHGFKLCSGGTDNHLMLLDLRGTGITGKQAEELLEQVNITCNKNAVVNDPEKPTVTSGLRIGTPAATTRGLKEDDMILLGDAIAMTLKDPEHSMDKAREIVRSITEKYPLY